MASKGLLYTSVVEITATNTLFPFRSATDSVASLQWEGCDVRSSKKVVIHIYKLKWGYV